MAKQTGLPPLPADAVRGLAPADAVVEPRRTRLAQGRLRMVDQITGWWPQGGEAGLGLARGRQEVDPESWYFKAHFFQDPVQPGSLGVEALHVPYKGGAQALTDTIGAQVQFTFTAIAQAAPHVRAGTLVPIATTGARRPASMPAVPTIAESGLPGYEIASRLGLMAPRGTPDEVVRKLGEAVERIVRSAEFAEFCQAQGLDVDYANAAAYAGAAAQELAYWASVVGRSGAKAD